MAVVRRTCSSSRRSLAFAGDIRFDRIAFWSWSATSLVLLLVALPTDYVQAQLTFSLPGKWGSGRKRSEPTAINFEHLLAPSKSYADNHGQSWRDASSTGYIVDVDGGDDSNINDYFADSSTRWNGRGLAASFGKKRNTGVTDADILYGRIRQRENQGDYQDPAIGSAFHSPVEGDISSRPLTRVVSFSWFRCSLNFSADPRRGRWWWTKFCAPLMRSQGAWSRTMNWRFEKLYLVMSKLGMSNVAYSLCQTEKRYASQKKGWNTRVLKPAAEFMIIWLRGGSELSLVHMFFTSLVLETP